MNESPKFIVILSVMVVMTMLFWIVFGVVVCYLVSLFRLNQHLQRNEADLWRALGRPEISPMVHSINPFKGFAAEIGFLVWFLKGGEGAQLQETKAMLEKTRRLFKRGMIGFFSLIVLFLILMGIIVFPLNL